MYDRVEQTFVEKTRRHFQKGKKREGREKRGERERSPACVCVGVGVGT